MMRSGNQSKLSVSGTLEAVSPARSDGELSTRKRRGGALRGWTLALCLIAVIAVPASLCAQAFRPIPALGFTKGFGGGDPLPQLITIASTGANFAFTATATSTTGGSWLTITPSSFGCCSSTPFAVTVKANPAVDLAAGTYTGQIVVKSASGTLTMTIPVSLTIHASSVAFFDDVAGGLTFSLQTSGGTPPGQALQIRNAGSGTLTWTASTTTSDGGAWLKMSSASGTAPSNTMVSVVLASLPGSGLTAGTFTGQIVLKATGSQVTIPVTVIVGDSVFRQINPMGFAKVYGGGNPLSQVITVASTGAQFTFNALVLNSTGGNWLQINPGAYGCCTATPQAITVSVNPSVTLAVGTYSAEVMVYSNTSSMGLSIPVTLTINPSSAAFFDDIAGAIDFSMETGGGAPPPQAMQIRNAGAGALAWTASVSTSDGGQWLGVSPASGTAPSTLSATVVPENLPTNGLAAGTFTGQIVLSTASGVVTVPVTFVVGSAVFRQVNPLNFTKGYGGANPLPQVVTIASTGADFTFNAVAVTSTGGSWLQITPGAYGCCTGTPQAVTVSVAPAANLAIGTYSAEIIVKANAGSPGMSIPVTLTIEPTTATFFDNLPGQLTFSMVTKGTRPPSQTLEIRNAGGGTLNWTASVSTSDGGGWLSLSASSGTAPSSLAVSVNPANLPGGGLTAGTFTGQVVLLTAGNRATIPVTMTVGDSVFRQINALDFNKVYGGANPLPQIITVASTGANLSFNATAVSATGGNWLTISPSAFGCCTSTPLSLTVSANPAVTLAAGTYTAEIVVKANVGSPSMTIPVTLKISSAGSPFFDDLPGAVDFYELTGGTAPPAQSFTIRNAGAGTLNWSAAPTTADGGSWLTISAASGTAPSSLTVSVHPANLPGKGLTAGIFIGQIVLVTPGDRQTIPVTYVVGANVFKPAPELSFTKPYGGANPAAQLIVVASTGTNFSFTGVAANATGGNWLQITPSSFGCCASTPLDISVSVNPSASLAAGAYTAEVILLSNSGGMPLVVPETLTVVGTAATATPVFSPPPGAYAAAQSVVITDSTRGAAIYYTLDGSTPTTSSRVYSVPITVAATETIKSLAVAPGFRPSAVGVATYTINTTIAATPAVMQTITISEATAGATVYYTTNGSTPTTSSAKYTGPITISSSAVLKFIAVAPGYSQSAVRTVNDSVF